jgi:hypothetical protein
MVTSDGGGERSMKVAQLRDVLESASRLYRDSGNEVVARSIDDFSGLFHGRETMTVSAFAALLAKVTPSKNALD